MWPGRECESLTYVLEPIIKYSFILTLIPEYASTYVLSNITICLLDLQLIES